MSCAGLNWFGLPPVKEETEMTSTHGSARSLTFSESMKQPSATPNLEKGRWEHNPTSLEMLIALNFLLGIWSYSEPP